MTEWMVLASRDPQVFVVMKTTVDKLAISLMIPPLLALMLFVGGAIASFTAPQAEVPRFLTLAVWWIYPLAWIFSIANYFLFRRKSKSMAIRCNLIISQIWIVLMAVMIFFLLVFTRII